MHDIDAKTDGRKTFIINTAYYALAAALVYLAVRFVMPWFMPFIIGYVIALICRPLVRLLTERGGMNHKFAGFLAIIVAYTVLVSLLVRGGVVLVNALRRWIAGLPYFYENTFEPAVRAMGGYIENMFGNMFPGFPGYEAINITLQDFQSALIAFSTTLLNMLGAVGANIPRFVLAFIFTILSSLIISMNYSQVTGFLSRQIPDKYREIIDRIKTDARRSFGKYLLANLKMMGITFVVLLIGLSVLGVRNAPLVALGIAAFDFFPVVGVGGIVLPWAVLELVRLNFPLALGFVVIYGIVVMTRGFVEPRILGGQLGLHPLLTLCALYVGFATIGVIGMVIFPIAAQILTSLHRSGVLKLWRD